MQQADEPVVVQTDSAHPFADRALTEIETASGVVGLAIVLARYGLTDLSFEANRWLGYAALACLLFPLATSLLRLRWSFVRAALLREYLASAWLLAIWLVGLTGIAATSGVFATSGPRAGLLTEPAAGWCELMLIARGVIDLVRMIRHAAMTGLNPALVFVASFVVLIGSGALLLMMPRCNAEGVPTDWLTALFTSTSACCVTGLVVVDTGTHWSRAGHVVIMLLIQIGGLGIMTFGGFFAAIGGRTVGTREAANMRDLLDAETIGSIRRTVFAIIGLTFGIEAMGAVALATLPDDGTLGERAFFGLFHAVSAFCNAGFSTRSANLLGWETRWQVWGCMSGLIILGGFGFAPLDNIRRVLVSSVRRWRRGPLSIGGAAPPVRLQLHTRLVTITTLALLVGGGIVLFGLEWNNPACPLPVHQQVANAWFHSVTLRTAGFNTVDHGALYPATKLFGIALMFVGASPGSTGGGVKTICLAVSLLALRSVLRSQNRVEAFRRTIAIEQVLKALAVVALGLATVMTTTLLLVVVEDRPELFLDHMYEATSAFGTVGVSANISPGLRPVSKLIVILTMFLGRVGPLTLVAALASRSFDHEYRYPEERVSLG